MRGYDRNLEKQLEIIDRKISSLHHSDYNFVKKNLRSMLWYNFLIGLARGLGMAGGFTILGALVIYILQKLVLLHLPGISQMISEIIRFVEMYDKK